jgi:iron(III) transport system substrate-binding protein
VRHRVRFRAAAVALVMALAACGGTPTADDAAGGGKKVTGDIATDALAKINQQLEGLDAQARRDKLIELAKKEGGTVTFYGSTNPEDVDPVIKAFEDQTGIEVKNYRADAADVAQRIEQEADAGHAGADIAISGAAETNSMHANGLLANWESPVAKDIYEGGSSDWGLDVYRVMRIVAYNTDKVKNPPTSWEQLFEDYPGQVMLDPSDYDWFATLTTQYFEGKKGMTEEEAIDYWKSIAKNLVVVKGHTLSTQLVTTGEYALSAVTYQHGLPPKDAPVAWEPPIWPVIMDATREVIPRTAEHPASALLFAEFMLTDGQTILYKGGRSPANVTVPSSWPEKYDDTTVTIDTKLYTDEATVKHWQDLYEEVLSSAGKGGS